jgi:hypothetical protein
MFYNISLCNSNVLPLFLSRCISKLVCLKLSVKSTLVYLKARLRPTLWKTRNILNSGSNNWGKKFCSTCPSGGLILFIFCTGLAQDFKNILA